MNSRVSRPFPQPAWGVRLSRQLHQPRQVPLAPPKASFRSRAGADEAAPLLVEVLSESSPPENPPRLSLQQLQDSLGVLLLPNGDVFMRDRDTPIRLHRIQPVPPGGEMPPDVFHRPEQAPVQFVYAFEGQLIPIAAGDAGQSGKKWTCLIPFDEDETTSWHLLM